jgi:PKHD-type hydroxylase
VSLIMILCVNGILNSETIAWTRAALREAPWVHGAATAGWHARSAKLNHQVDSTWPGLAPLQERLRVALTRHPLFDLAVRPRRLTRPLLSRYGPEMCYASHVDNAVMGARGSEVLRADVSITLFLSAPEDYDGGELVIESTTGEEDYKLQAGSGILYPASTLHRVAPVSRGERLAAVFWAQSLVRDPARRELLFDLETAKHALFETQGKTREFDLIARSVSNLLRMWVDI